MTTTSTTPAATSRPRRLATLVGLVIPLALVVVSTAVMLIALPTAPAEVVVHWGIDGERSMGPAWTFPLLTIVIGAGIPVLLWAIGVRGRAVGDAVVLLASTALAVAAMLAVVMPWSLIAQPADAVVPALTGAAVGLGVGAGAWFLMPRDPMVQPSAVAAEPIAAPRGARSVWSSVVRMPASARIGIAAGILVSAVAVGIAIAVAGAGAWWLVIVPLVLIVAFLTTTEFRVTAGRAGLVVRSVIGWPAFRVAAGELEHVEITTIEPMTDFGGWGLRIALTRGGARRAFGVVMRAGEAIEVTRRDGRVLVVTVDDAATGASVLAAAMRDAPGAATAGIR